VGLNQGLAADLGMRAGGRSVAGDDPYGLGRLFASAEPVKDAQAESVAVSYPGWHDTATAASAAPVSGKRL
jgi:hypothetical protein